MTVTFSSFCCEIFYHMCIPAWFSYALWVFFCIKLLEAHKFFYFTLLFYFIFIIFAHMKHVPNQFFSGWNGMREELLKLWAKTMHSFLGANTRIAIPLLVINVSQKWVLGESHPFISHQKRVAFIPTIFVVTHILLKNVNITKEGN